VTEPYSENNPDHVPNPLYVTGSIDTTGTGGGAVSIAEVSPVFAQARADALGEDVVAEAAAPEEEAADADAEDDADADAAPAKASKAAPAKAGGRR
jgi:hypothetical protein